MSTEISIVFSEKILEKIEEISRSEDVLSEEIINDSGD
jgi:hypothetical protein